MKWLLGGPDPEQRKAIESLEWGKYHVFCTSGIGDANNVTAMRNQALKWWYEKIFLMKNVRNHN